MRPEEGNRKHSRIHPQSKMSSTFYDHKTIFGSNELFACVSEIADCNLIRKENYIRWEYDAPNVHIRIIL